MGAMALWACHQTTALSRPRVRHGPKAAIHALEGLNVEIYYGDITDRSSVLDAMRGCLRLLQRCGYRAWLVTQPALCDKREALQTVLGAAID